MSVLKDKSNLVGVKMVVKSEVYDFTGYALFISQLKTLMILGSFFSYVWIKRKD